MQQIVACLATQHDELDILLSDLDDAVRSRRRCQISTTLSGLDDTGWTRSTRCPGWTVADVVLHLAQTDELTVASIHGRRAEAGSAWTMSGDDQRTVDDDQRTVDDAAAAAVPAQRGASVSACPARSPSCSTPPTTVSGHSGRPAPRCRR
jgi:uncharacterized protein (TIGR03083 family)